MYSQDVPTTAAPDHESASRMTEEETPDEASDPGMKLDRLTVRPAENGGFIVDCSKSPIKPPKKGAMSMGGYSSKDYAFSTKEDLFAFLQKELA
jgi:hypothetical protein